MDDDRQYPSNKCDLLSLIAIYARAYNLKLRSQYFFIEKNNQNIDFNSI